MYSHALWNHDALHLEWRLMISILPFIFPWPFLDADEVQWFSSVLILAFFCPLPSSDSPNTICYIFLGDKKMAFFCLTDLLFLMMTAFLWVLQLFISWFLVEKLLFRYEYRLTKKKKKSSAVKFYSCRWWMPCVLRNWLVFLSLYPSRMLLCVGS